MEEEQMRLIKVVEYLEPTMAKELLGKFPDNSAFDFDYTQSSIWSPLAPRPFKPLQHPPFTFNIPSPFDDLDSVDGGEVDVSGGTPDPPSRCMAARYHIGFGFVGRSALKRASSNFKSMAASTALNLNLGRKSKRFKKMQEVSAAPHMPAVLPTPPSATKQGGKWAKVLKVASKHFKKKKKKKDEVLRLGHTKLPGFQAKDNLRRTKW